MRRAGLRRAAIGSAIFNLASTAVAQKHLQDITQELKQIKAVVKNIEQHLQDIDSSDIESLHDYVHESYKDKENLSPEAHIALEIKVSDINKSIKLFNRRITSLSTRVINIDHNKFWASSVYEPVQEVFVKLKSYSRLYFLSLQTYLVCKSLRYENTESNADYVSLGKLNALLLIKDVIYNTLGNLKSKIELTKSDLRLISRKEYDELKEEIEKCFSLIKSYEQDTLNLYAFMYPDKTNSQFKNKSLSLLLEKDNQTEEIKAFLLPNKNDELLERQVNFNYAYAK